MHRLLVIGATTLAALLLGGTAGAWTWPADGAVLRPFELGPDTYAAGQHRGIDVGGEEGSPVRAPAAGTVTFAGSLPTHGRGVTILTSDGYAVTLVHLGSIAVAKGDAVDEGAPVGTMGFSGEAEHAVPSIHLGIRVAAQAEGYVDPIGLLPTRPVPGPAAPPTPAPVPAPEAAPATPPAAQTAPAPVPAAPSTTPTPTSSASVPQPSPSAAPGPTAAPPAPASASASSPPAAVPGPTASAAGEGSGQPPTPPTTAPSVAPAVADSAAEERSTAAPAREPSFSTGATVVDVGAPVLAVAPPVTHGPAGMWVQGRPVGVEPVEDGPVRAREPETIAGRHPEPRVGRADVQADVAASSSEAVDRATAGSTVGHRRDNGMDGRPLAASSEPAARPASGGVPLSGRSLRAIPGASAGSTVAHVVAGTAADAAGGSAPDIGVIAATVALIVLLAVAAWRKAARRIDGDGALLPDNADLLRQLDAAHRPRVHDGRGGRLRTPSAAARP